MGVRARPSTLCPRGEQGEGGSEDLGAPEGKQAPALTWGLEGLQVVPYPREHPWDLLQGHPAGPELAAAHVLPAGEKLGGLVVSLHGHSPSGPGWCLVSDPKVPVWLRSCPTLTRGQFVYLGKQSASAVHRLPSGLRGQGEAALSPACGHGICACWAVATAVPGAQGTVSGGGVAGPLPECSELPLRPAPPPRPSPALGDTHSHMHAYMHIHACTRVCNTRLSSMRTLCSSGHLEL